MGIATFVKRQVEQIRQGGRQVFVRKVTQAVQFVLILPLYMLAVPAVLSIRLVRPWLLVRWAGLRSERIGHFSLNTELYLCERDAGINMPSRRHVDLFYFGGKPICNCQLAIMWRRVLRVWPWWVLAPISRVNRLLPDGLDHEIGNNTQGDRDVHNLLDQLPSHLTFTAREEARGEAGLRAMGISPGAPFVCLVVRDSAYLDAHMPVVDWSYHNYRDSNIQNYVLAAEELAERGYFVIRTGAKVQEPIKTKHPWVIDYATNGMRSDFMDVYLAAKCDFCLSGGSGFSAVFLSLRRPVVAVNVVPLKYLCTFTTRCIAITKHHFAVQQNRQLTLQGICTYGVSSCSLSADFESKGIRLIENTPEEIRDVAMEMVERLNGTYLARKEDEAMQSRFWEFFPKDELHGMIKSRIGTAFLRQNWAERV